MPGLSAEVQAAACWTAGELPAPVLSLLHHSVVHSKSQPGLPGRSFTLNIFPAAHPVLPHRPLRVLSDSLPGHPGLR